MELGEFGQCVLELRPCGVVVCRQRCETQRGHVPTALLAPTVQALGPGPLLHIACAVPLMDTGHTKSGLACACLERPAEGVSGHSVGLALHCFFLWSRN